MDNIMETIGLRKAYKGTVVVDDVNIHIPKGQYMVLLVQTVQEKVRS